MRLIPSVHHLSQGWRLRRSRSCARTSGGGASARSAAEGASASTSAYGASARSAAEGREHLGAPAHNGASARSAAEGREHQRRRSQCKHCGGGIICEHQRIQSRCEDCTKQAQTTRAQSNPPRDAGGKRGAQEAVLGDAGSRGAKQPRAELTEEALLAAPSTN
jgi:hypothetical protein